MYLWMLTYKNEADWDQIDKNPTMFLKRMYRKKKKSILVRKRMLLFAT